MKKMEIKELNNKYNDFQKISDLRYWVRANNRSQFKNFNVKNEILNAIKTNKYNLKTELEKTLNNRRKYKDYLEEYEKIIKDIDLDYNNKEINLIDRLFFLIVCNLLKKRPQCNFKLQIISSCDTPKRRNHYERSYIYNYDEIFKIVEENDEEKNFSSSLEKVDEKINLNYKCLYCNHLIKSTDKYCSNCGKSQVEQISFVNCAKCGKLVKSDLSFCSNCGTELQKILNKPVVGELNDNLFLKPKKEFIKELNDSSMVEDNDEIICFLSEGDKKLLTGANSPENGNYKFKLFNDLLEKNGVKILSKKAYLEGNYFEIKVKAKVINRMLINNDFIHIWVSLHTVDNIILYCDEAMCLESDDYDSVEEWVMFKKNEISLDKIDKIWIYPTREKRR